MHDGSLSRKELMAYYQKEVLSYMLIGSSALKTYFLLLRCFPKQDLVAQT